LASVEEECKLLRKQRDGLFQLLQEVHKVAGNLDGKAGPAETADGEKCNSPDGKTRAAAEIMATLSKTECIVRIHGDDCLKGSGSEACTLAANLCRKCAARAYCAPRFDPDTGLPQGRCSTVYPLKDEKSEPHRWLKISVNGGPPAALADAKLKKPPPEGLDELLLQIREFVYGSAMARMWLNCLVSKEGAPRMRPRPFIVKQLDAIVSRTDWTVQERAEAIKALTAKWMKMPLPPAKFMK
jgi:hypothetical protein